MIALMTVARTIALYLVKIIHFVETSPRKDNIYIE